MTITGWCFLRSALTDSSNTVYVAELDSSGSGLSLVPIAANNPRQLWMFTSDGRMFNAAAVGTVLTPPATSGGAVTMAAQLLPDSQTQVWTLTSANEILNAQSQMALCSAGSPEISPPINAETGGSGPAFVWYQQPSQPLAAILALPPLPFPIFTGDELTAYQDVEKRLKELPKGVDLRSEYTNTNAPLAIWAASVHLMRVLPPPKGVAEAAWRTVTKQLYAELTDAATVQNLFTSYNTFQTDLTTDQSTTLTTLGGDVQIENGTNTSAVFTAVLQGAIYTLLSAIPEVGGVIGNIVNTGITAALSANTISANPFTATYAQLWSALSDSYGAVLTAIGTMATEILSDWGKLQATARLALKPGPYSLEWPETATSTMIDASRPGFSIRMMQILLPTMYQIYVYQEDNDDQVDAPPYAQWIQPIGNDTWNKYWIAGTTDWDEYPAQVAIVTDVFGNGATPEDFWTGRNGWAFPMVPCYDSFGVKGANNVVVTLTNQTNDILSATIATPTEGNPLGSATKTILPSTSVQLAAAEWNNYFQGSITITDASSGATVATLQLSVSQPLGGFEGLWPVVSGSASPGYALSPPICNQAAVQGGLKDGYPGAAQVSIFAT